MPLKAIVFDLDGTLLDQDGAERDALRKLYDLHFAMPSKPAYPAFLRDWRNAADDFLQRFLDHHMGFEEQRIARVRAVSAKYGSPCTAEEAARLARIYAQLYEDEWRLYADALPALDRLARRFRLAVITNGDGKQQRAKLAATGITGRFEHILVSGDTPVRKPDPAIFRLSEQALNLRPEELAYIGDRIEVDVAGAKSAGWTAVWVDRKGMPKGGSESAQLVTERLTDLEALLEGGA